MALRRNKFGFGSAITEPPHESGAASRPLPPLSRSHLPQAQRMKKQRHGYALFRSAGSLVAQPGINTFGVPVMFGEPRRSYKTCWLWVVLLVFLLSTLGVYSAEDSSEDHCRCDLTSVAALSCLHSNGALRQPPSLTCCKALLHAIDRVPASGHSGACWLCRYLRDKKRLPKLATTYVLCKGKDSHIVRTWSSFPLAKCSVVCRRTSSVGMGKDQPVEHSRRHNTDKAKGISHILWAVVIFVLMGLSYVWYLWKFKLAPNASEQGGRLSLNGDPQADRRRPPGHSSTKRKGHRTR